LPAIEGDLQAMPLRILAVALLLAAFPTEASANVIWPAAILTGRLLDWWIIAASILIEFFFVQRAFRLKPLDALWATLGANAVSTVLGLYALPYGGMFMEIGIHHSGLGDRIGWNTFSLTAWIITFILAVVINLAAELAVYRFGYRLNVDRRAVWLIALANIITAAIAFASLDIVRDPIYGESSPGLLPN
jgi:hypothetical protein